MGFKMAPQIMGLVRGEPKEGQKHRANGKAILGELGEERHSASMTLDPSRSHLNEYAGFTSGFACWDSLLDEADAFRVQVNTKNGVRERKLPPDAVIGWAAIINPPADMTVGWDAATYSRFFTDSMKVTADIIPDIFSPENVRMEALHKDEGFMNDAGEYGWNFHVVGVPKGGNGRYCGNQIDAKRCVLLCAEFPRKMRELGWDLDDLDLTDFTRMGFQKDNDGNYLLDENGERIPIDAAYREERKAKRKEQGRKTNKFIADKKAKAAAMTSEAKAIKDQATKDADAAAAKVQDAETKVENANAKLLELNQSYSSTYFAKAALESEIDDMTEFLAWKREKKAKEAAQKPQDGQDDARTALGIPDAQDAARTALEAQTARNVQADATRLRTAEEMIADFRKQMGQTPPAPAAPVEQRPAPAPAPAEPPPGSIMAKLRARAAEAATKQQDKAPAPEAPDF